MAVAEKTIAERTPRNPERELALASLLGGLYVLAGLWIVFAGLWELWANLFPSETGLSLTDALLLIVVMGAAVGEFFLGLYLEKTAAPPHGFRAGAFAVCAGVAIIVWITHWIGDLLSQGDMGGFGMRVHHPGEIQDALDKAVASGKPAVVDAVSDINGIAPRAWTPS